MALKKTPHHIQGISLPYHLGRTVTDIAESKKRGNKARAQDTTRDTSKKVIGVANDPLPTRNAVMTLNNHRNLKRIPR
jgi:hypothetical protein